MNRFFTFGFKSLYLLFGVFFALGLGAQAEAFWDRGDRPLVVINGEEFTSEDYSRWWREWQEPGMTVPEDPEEFIDWMLLAQEAERMELYETAAYRHKVNVFLKVRALLALRAEEVNGRLVPPSEETLWGLYQGQYAPQLNLHLLALKKQEEVDLLQAAVAQGEGLSGASQKAGFDNPHQQMQETGLLRPHNIPAPIRDVALSLSPGEVGGPVNFEDTWYFLELVSSTAGSKEDFRTFEDSLRRKFNKAEEGRLTRELISRLKAKYEVVIDHDLIAAIGPEGAASKDAAKIVLKMDDLSVSAEQFSGFLKKDAKLRNVGSPGGLDLETLRKIVIDGIVVQTLLGKEAIARKYEQKEPLKSVFNFYSQHRLIKELEKELVWPQVTVEDDAITSEYQQHPDRYLANPEGVADIADVELDDPKLAAILEARLRSGEEFFSVMKTVLPKGVPTRRVELHKLQPEFKAVLKGMAQGQVRSNVPVGEKILFVKMVKGITDDILPLERVAKQIQQRLRKERFNTSRRQLLNELRSLSTINVDKKGWERLRSQLVEHFDHEK